MISIAMTTYNGERFLREQLDSIIAQTVSDWELIVCDDCSSDGTYKILEEYAASDKRIHPHLNEHNLGFKKNFERAISLCTGEYIALSDQDDVWLSNHLSLLLDSLSENQLVCSNAIQIDANGNNLGRMQKGSDLWVSNNPDEQFFEILFFNYVQGCTALFRSELKKLLIPIPDEQPFHDYWLGIVASVKGKICYLPEPTVLYRQHSDSVTDNSVTTFKERFADLKLVYANLAYAHSAISKLPLSESQYKIYVPALNFLKDFSKSKGRLKYIPFFVKNYHLIHATKSLKLFLPRFFKRFLFKK